MTLREKLADWISGGMLTHWKRVAKDNQNGTISVCRNWRKTIAIANQYQNTLQYIIEQDTPGANATVKRIIHVAKEALK